MAEKTRNSGLLFEGRLELRDAVRELLHLLGVCIRVHLPLHMKGKSQRRELLRHDVHMTENPNVEKMLKQDVNVKGKSGVENCSDSMRT